jgi:cation diffusion facilitator family transporter
MKQQHVLVLVLGLTGTFCVVEGTVGVLTHRLVLQADALHLAMDVLALMVSLVAMRLSTRPPTLTFTFGLHRAEALAAMMNALLVLGGTLYIVREGLEGLSEPGAGHHAGGSFALTAGVSVAALCVNGISAWLLHRGIEAGHHHHGHAHHGHAHAAPRKTAPSPHAHDHDHDHHDHDHHDHDHHDDAHEHVHQHAEDVEDADHSLNLRGAWLHVLGDALGSFAALSTSIAMHFGAPSFVDPIASFLVAAILIVGASRVLRDGALVLLEGAPRHLPVERVRALIAKVDGVDDVLGLHLWSLGSGKDAAAVRVRATSLDVGARVEARLRDEEDLSHVWVHVEPPVK